ncbi:MAG: type II toxin-antitoxin system VapC family toxin [Anaerolineae bacterium]|nr:type II toxin-antitoxin system VapC family toxin [Anaerolineae bacterium]
MAVKVLDAYALMAFFEDEPGADAVRAIIQESVEKESSLAMSVVNLGEIWYAIARSNSAEVADRYIGDIKGMGIEIVDADWALTRQAANFKARGNISYADSFAAALAVLKNAELVTGDKEFKPLEGEIRIMWL